MGIILETFHLFTDTLKKKVIELWSSLRQTFHLFMPNLIAMIFFFFFLKKVITIRESHIHHTQHKIWW